MPGKDNVDDVDGRRIGEGVDMIDGDGEERLVGEGEYRSVDAGDDRVERVVEGVERIELIEERLGSVTAGGLHEEEWGGLEVWMDGRRGEGMYPDEAGKSFPNGSWVCC